MTSSKTEGLDFLCRSIVHGAPFKEYVGGDKNDSGTIESVDDLFRRISLKICV